MTTAARSVLCRQVRLLPHRFPCCAIWAKLRLTAACCVLHAVLHRCVLPAVDLVAQQASGQADAVAPDVAKAVYALAAASGSEAAYTTLVNMYEQVRWGRSLRVCWHADVGQISVQPWEGSSCWQFTCTVWLVAPLG